MRMPDRDNITSKVKIQSPLVAGSIDSNDSDPIDISRASAPMSSYTGTSASSAHFAHYRSAPMRSFPSSSYASSHNRRTSMSRSIGSFVGSYEESILNGRMSQTPSKPLDFTATIGVLGRGQCKSSLRCPPHLSVQFPAYFYSETSPYVGQIDVEQSDDDKSMGSKGYRIPAEGQLQVIIKNPNKTAVKLFLIPYNVSDMPPLSKTFFRQKHYDVGDGDKLRYAIHIQISCHATGKYYVHKSQRVVFANRVPDGKENLRIVMQSPSPAYTPWVPEKRQKRSDRYLRPDRKEPRFLGGSLLDRDHEIGEEQVGLLYGETLVRSGQTTPKPSYRPTKSPLFMPSRNMSDVPEVLLGEPRVDHGPGVPAREARSTNGGGILAERLKALALAGDDTRTIK